MKLFLRILFVQLIMCATLSAYAINDYYTSPGVFTWTCPAGVTSVTVTMWGAGGMGFDGYSGGGGAFSIGYNVPVTPGQAYVITVGTPITLANYNDYYHGVITMNSEFGPGGGNIYVNANGATYNASGSYSPGAAFGISNFTSNSYAGGSGVDQKYDGVFYTPSGGGSSGSVNGPGTNGTFNGAGGVLPFGGGGNGGNPGYNGNWPGGGGGGGFNETYTTGGAGEVIIGYACPTISSGTIGNGHTVAYPQELIPDNITNVTNPDNVSASNFIWQQSTDNINFVATKSPSASLSYRFDLDSLQTTTYYRRGNNACTGTYGNWSSSVKITVFTYGDNGNGGRNGTFSGNVLSKNGTGINLRKVYAKSLTPLKGRPVGFLDSAITNENGYWHMDSVFYGNHSDGDSTQVRFLIYSDTSGQHLYKPINEILSFSSHTFININIIDSSLFAVTGQVYQVCAGCLNSSNQTATITGPLDSVQVFGLGASNSASQVESDSSKTGYKSAQGSYGIYSLLFAYTDNYTITPKYLNQKFNPAKTVVFVNGNVANINFNDTTTHVISGTFSAGCGDVIGTAVLEFDDSLHIGYDSLPQKSVFRKRVTTSANGKYSIRLPARAYKVKIISATISDPVDKSTTQASVKAFFAALPADSMYRDISSKDTVLNLVYHRAPQITIDGLRDDSMRVQTCSAFKNYDFWPQGVKRPIRFNVYQGPASKGCLTDSGVVYVKTDISINTGHFNYDTVPVSHGVAIDSIVAAQPNIVKDPITNTYSKTITAKYTDILGRSFSTDTSKPALPIIVVTGASIDPSGTNYVTVSPQIPMLVLHDPPGSNSSAKWAKDVSASTTLGFTAKSAVTEGAYVKAKIGLDEMVGMFVETKIAAGVGIDADFSTTQTFTNTDETTITNTAQHEIKTSEDPAYIGRDADLVYGEALNINYKEGKEVDWDSAKCLILDPFPIMVTDVKNTATTYLYTIGSIRDEEIPRLERAAVASTNPDSAAYFRNQESVWQQLIDHVEENNKTAPVITNRSISNGGELTESQTLANDSKNTFSFELEIANNFAIEMGFEIAGNGITAGSRVNFKVNTGWDNTVAHSTATTTSYTLKDLNAGLTGSYSGDYFSVNVKKDPVYGTPMFETVAGGTQCPHEEGTVSLYHPFITAPITTKTGLTRDTASYTIYLNNLSNDPTPNGKRPYILFADAASNPAGATILVNGASANNPTTFNIPNNGGQLPVTVNIIRNTAGGIYDYDNVKLIMTDPCFSQAFPLNFYQNPHEYDTVLLSTDFAAPVSGVTLVAPVNNWVSTKANHDSVKVTFSGYDTSKLASIAVQYNVPGTGAWITITTIAKTKLGKTSTTYYWKTGNRTDGPYNLRLQVKDKLNNIVYSTVATGLIDRIAPALFGVPQPANGTYTAGTQIAYSYTENINTTNLSNSTVSMRDMTANTTTPVQLSAFGNTLIVVPSAAITGNTGHQYRVIANGVSDLYGNVKTTPDTTYFIVGSTSFGTGGNALNVSTTPASIYEDSKGFLRVRFTRNTITTDTIVVYYNISGNAVYNKDYTITYNAKGQSSATGISGAQGQLLLPKDSSKVEIYIHPINDSIGMLNKILNITLSPGGDYTLGSNYRIADTILNHNTVAPIITANKSTTLCSGDSVKLSTANTINGVAVASYLWSTGAKTRSITVKKSGSYTVRVTDVNGLIGYSAPTVVTITCGSPANLTATMLNTTSAVLRWDAVSCAVKYNVQYKKVSATTWKSDTVNTAKDTIKGLTANTTYQWKVASICRYPSIIISGYTAGANFTTPASVSAIIVTRAADYSKAAAGDGFTASLHPNPASTNVNVEVKGAKGAYSIMLTNLQGVVLWKANELTGSSVKIPLSNFAKGIYMVVVSDHVHTGTLKLVKE